MGLLEKRTREPCAMKVASTVRRGGVGKVLPKQLICSLPYYGTAGLPKLFPFWSNLPYERKVCRIK